MSTYINHLQYLEKIVKGGGLLDLLFERSEPSSIHTQYVASLGTSGRDFDVGLTDPHGDPFYLPNFPRTPVFMIIGDHQITDFEFMIIPHELVKLSSVRVFHHSRYAATISRTMFTRHKSDSLPPTGIISQRMHMPT